MALLCLAVSASYRRAVTALRSNSTAGSPSRWLRGTAALRSLAHGTVGLLGFALALWSKETAITLIAVLIVYDHARLASARAWWRPTSGTLLRGSALAALGYGYLRTRMHVMSIGGASSWESASLSTSQLARARNVAPAKRCPPHAPASESAPGQQIRRAENPLAYLQRNGAPLRTRVLTIANVHVRYALLLVNPLSPLCCEYSYNCVPAVHEWRDPRNPAALVLYATVIALAVGALRQFGCVSGDGRSRTGGRGALAVCLAWMLLPFVPASHVFATVGTLLAERLLYVPSIGFALLVGSASASLFTAIERALCHATAFETPETPVNIRAHHRDPRGESRASSRSIPMLRLIAGGAFAASLGVMVERTRARTAEWKDDVSLFRSAIEVCPNSAKLQHHVGQLALNVGNLTTARAHLTRARAIDPEFCDIDVQDALVHIGEVSDSTAWNA